MGKRANKKVQKENASPERCQIPHCENVPMDPLLCGHKFCSALASIPWHLDGDRSMHERPLGAQVTDVGKPGTASTVVVPTWLWEGLQGYDETITPFGCEGEFLRRMQRLGPITYIMDVNAVGFDLPNPGDTLESRAHSKLAHIDIALQNKTYRDILANMAAACQEAEATNKLIRNSRSNGVALQSVVIDAHSYVASGDYGEADYGEDAEGVALHAP